MSHTCKPILSLSSFNGNPKSRGGNYKNNCSSMWMYINKCNIGWLIGDSNLSPQGNSFGQFQIVYSFKRKKLIILKLAKKKLNTILNYICKV
jgi:hypothetical protein